MKLISQADVVLALGTRLGPFGTLPQHGMDYWPKNAKIIQIDADHKMLGLVKKISVGICGDAKAAAVALTERLEGKALVCDGNRAARGEKIDAEKAAWEKELDEWTHERDAFSLDMIAEQEGEDGNWLHPRQVLRELEKAMPEDVMVSTDIGNINSVANSYLRFEKPRSFLAPMSFGNCGYALPTVIGAKAAAPERPAIAYAGDGAWGMSLGEIMTLSGTTSRSPPSSSTTGSGVRRRRTRSTSTTAASSPVSSRASPSPVSHRRWAPRASSWTSSRRSVPHCSVRSPRR